MTQKDLRVAVVGCGQIADAHLQEIAKVKGACVVSVCDREPDLAYQAAARFGISGQDSDLNRMLAKVEPDVVHITTPPHTHFPIASACLRQGAHVYVEKPFALDAGETRQLLALAASQRRIACVGHDHLFDPVWMTSLEAIRDGRIGTIVHIDSQQGYDPNGPFGRLIQGDPHHWIHGLRGGIFQNVISHAVSKVTPFLNDPRPEISALAFGDPGVCPLPIDLRVILRGETVSANITLLGRAKPVRRVVWLSGTKGGLEVDFDAGLTRSIRAARFPGALGRIEVPLNQTLEGLRNTGKALAKFWRSELQYFAGMRTLFEAFYHAIRTGGSPPVSYDEIQRVANIMDGIFDDLDGRGRNATSTAATTVPESVPS